MARAQLRHLAHECRKFQAATPHRQWLRSSRGEWFRPINRKQKRGRTDKSASVNNETVCSSPVKPISIVVAVRGTSNRGDDSAVGRLRGLVLEFFGHLHQQIGKMKFRAEKGEPVAEVCLPAEICGTGMSCTPQHTPSNARFPSLVPLHKKKEVGRILHRRGRRILAQAFPASGLQPTDLLGQRFREMNHMMAGHSGARA
jgi:hypothetical protein